MFFLAPKKSSNMAVILGALLISVLVSGCPFEPEIAVTKWNPELVHNGPTLFNVNYFLNPMVSYLAMVDMAGELVWDFRFDGLGVLYEVEPLPNENLLIISGTNLYEINKPGDIVWMYSDDSAHHDVDVLSDGSIIYCYFDNYPMGQKPLMMDGVKIMDRTSGEVLWQWKVSDHLSMDDYCPICWDSYRWVLDWTHLNMVYFDEEDSAVYINLRNLNRMIKIDYPSGEILWSLGDGGDFGEGIFSHAHDPMLLPNGNILLFDHGFHRPGSTENYSRVIELEVDPGSGYAEIVWEYRETPDFYCEIGGDADRLPNGNTLIADAANSRVIEVSPDREVVWELRMPFLYYIYKAERLPFP